MPAHKMKSNNKYFGWLPVKKWITDRAGCHSAFHVCNLEAWENQLRLLPCSLVSLIGFLFVCYNLYALPLCSQNVLCSSLIMLHSLFISLLVHFSLWPDHLKDKDCLFYNLVFPGAGTELTGAQWTNGDRGREAQPFVHITDNL